MTPAVGVGVIPAVGVGLEATVGVGVGVTPTVDVGVTPTVGVGVTPTVGVGVGAVVGVGVGAVVGVGVGVTALTVNVAVTVTAEPTEGVTTTVAVYEPAARPATLTLNAGDEVTFGVLLPLVGLTVSQGAEGVPAVQVSVPPPMFVILMDCATGAVPADVE